MKRLEAPASLAEMQRWFSLVLRAPLDPSSRSFVASPEAWPPEAERLTTPGAHGTRRERLAVYNRQYWFRLFTAFGREYPLLARLVGHFRLNQLTQRFVLSRSLSGVDLGRAADGFDAFVAEELSRGELGLIPSLPAEVNDALRDAAAIDAAYRALWAAPKAPTLRPDPADLDALTAAPLVPSGAAVIVEEGWALLELRRALPGVEGEGAVALPERHDARRAVALVRRDGVIVEAPLEPLQALLYRELARRALPAALDVVAAASTSPSAELARDVERWVAWSVRAGLWAAPAPPAPLR